jgi:hypothetical protein
MALLLVFLSSLIGGWIFPWWWPALAAYAIGFWLPKRVGNAVASGFLGTAAGWLAWAAFFDWRNHHLLSGRVGELFHLPSVTAVLTLAAFVGGITGGMAAWAGYAMGAYLKPKFARDT